MFERGNISGGVHAHHSQDRVIMDHLLFYYGLFVGAVVQLVEYRTRNQEIAGSTHTRSTASNLEQVAILLCAQANFTRTWNALNLVS